MQIFRRPCETKAWQNRIRPAETMVKIHPDRKTLATGEETSSPYLTTEKESFTIWMKSLVFNTNGCTVFDSKGNIIYRVDNYNSKGVTGNQAEECYECKELKKIECQLME